jgi:hypothetical protein
MKIHTIHMKGTLCLMGVHLNNVQVDCREILTQAIPVDHLSLPKDYPDMCQGCVKASIPKDCDTIFYVRETVQFI